MTEVTGQSNDIPIPRVIDEKMRTFGITAAGILLNFGLFFLLALFAPLVVGIVCGYILGQKRNGILAGFLSAVFSYSLMFSVSVIGYDILALITAVLIMSFLGGFGGYIGALLRKRMIDSSLKYQQ